MKLRFHRLPKCSDEATSYRADGVRCVYVVQRDRNLNGREWELRVYTGDDESVTGLRLRGDHVGATTAETARLAKIIAQEYEYLGGASGTEYEPHKHGYRGRLVEAIREGYATENYGRP